MEKKKWFIQNIGPDVIIEHAELIENENSTKKIDYHQTILNIGYHWWQKQTNPNKMNYIDMINYISDTYGELFAGFILIGKYNQQVCNGGHTQYYNNGYGDGDGGCQDQHDWSHPLHRRLISWFKKMMELNNSDNNQTAFYLECNGILDILNEFMNLPIDRDKTYEEWFEGDEDEDGYSEGYYEEVENEDLGRMDPLEASKLDEKYYLIDDTLMAHLEELAKSIILKPKANLDYVERIING